MSTTLSRIDQTTPIDIDQAETELGDGRRRPARYFRRYGILHRVAALLLLIPAAPMVIVLIILVRLTSKGPGIFRQTRVGRGGKVFTLLKIRTMCDDAEAETGPIWTTSLGDTRITRLGRILRALHLDEFPQLWNVVKGEMALVGPRPERPEFVQKLARQIPGYLDRLSVLPGITGLAQLNLPPDSDLNSVRRKLVLDREYVEKGGFWLDVRILVCTFLRLLGIPGRRVKRILKLDRDPQVSDRDHVPPADPSLEFRAVGETLPSTNGVATKDHPLDNDAPREISAGLKPND